MTNIVTFPGATTIDIPPDRVLEAAIGKLDMVLLIGKDPEGRLYIASSTTSAGEIALLQERARLRLIDQIRAEYRDD
jgi:hypothetical protein